MSTPGADAMELLGRLRSPPGVRRDLTGLRVAFATAFPEHVVAADKDDRLARLLDELEQVGALKQTTRRRGARLPSGVQILGIPKGPTRTQGRDLPVLHSALKGARLATTGWTQEEVEVLERLSRFLRDEPDAPVVARRERSFRLFRDEKALDGLHGRRFGKLGLVDDVLLRCIDTPLPFAWVRVGRRAALRLLIIENSATFDSVSVVLNDQHDPPYDIVVWGNGHAIERTLPFALRLPAHAGTEAVDAIFYYGDLDPVGVEIPVRADRLARSLGLPPVLPEVALYEAVAAAPCAPYRKQHRPYGTSELAWLPPHVAGHAQQLHEQGLRVPQEAVDRIELARILGHH